MRTDSCLHVCVHTGFYLIWPDKVKVVKKAKKVWDVCVCVCVRCVISIIIIIIIIITIVITIIITVLLLLLLLLLLRMNNTIITETKIQSLLRHPRWISSQTTHTLSPFRYACMHVYICVCVYMSVYIRVCVCVYDCL